MRHELKIFTFSADELGERRTALLPAGWEPIGGDLRNGTLVIIATRPYVPHQSAGPER